MPDKKPQSRASRKGTTEQNRSARVVAVFASDLHLQELAWVNHTTLAWDACLAFHFLVDLANKYQSPLLVAGDLLDRPTPSAIVAQQLMSGLLRLKNQFIYVRGDHDGPWPGWPLAVSGGLPEDRVVELPGLVALRGGLRVTGAPWTPDADVPARLADLPEAEVVLLHQPLCEFADFEATLSVEDLPASHKLYIVGDIHTPAAKTTSHGSRVVSPGGTNAQSIQETDEKYAYLLRDDLTIRRTPIPGRRIIRASIMGGAEVDRVLTETVQSVMSSFENSARAEYLDRLPVGQDQETINRPIVRVDYAVSIPGVVDRIQSSLRGKCHLFMRPVDLGVDSAAPAETHLGRLDTAGIIGDPTAAIMAELNIQVDRTCNPGLYDACVELIRSPRSPREVLQELRKRAGVQ